LSCLMMNRTEDSHNAQTPSNSMMWDEGIG
jgi:hypothetical protein